MLCPYVPSPPPPRSPLRNVSHCIYDYASIKLSSLGQEPNTWIHRQRRICILLFFLDRGPNHTPSTFSISSSHLFVPLASMVDHKTNSSVRESVLPEGLILPNGKIFQTRGLFKSKAGGGLLLDLSSSQCYSFFFFFSSLSL